VRSSREKERPAESVNDWLGRTFSALLSEGRGNTLEDFRAAPIFDRPIMGVAESDDDIFEAFRTAVDPRHIRPADFLSTAKSRFPTEAGNGLRISTRWPGTTVPLSSATPLTRS
jgi:hypothetical protein